MSANAIDLRDEIVLKSQAGVGLREIEETVIERSALDEDEQAALWLLAWSLPTTKPVRLATTTLRLSNGR